jgi:hypothetical protein
MTHKVSRQFFAWLFNNPYGLGFLMIVFALLVAVLFLFNE